MKFRSPDGRTVRLNYVASAHPAPDLAGVQSALEKYAREVRERLEVETLGVTLLLPQVAAEEIDGSPAALESLRRTLADCGVEVTGIHGVPVRMYDPKRRYGVFRPDWAEPERLESTLRLTRILAGLLPEDETEGVVSTIPFFWRTRNDRVTRRAAEEALLRLADELERQRDATGKAVRVVMEPEPGCAVETSAAAGQWLSELFGSRLVGDAQETWLGLCLDTCHMAVQFEDATDAFERLPELRPAVLKLQISNALLSSTPSEELDSLEAFVDPARLHQTRERRVDGTVYGVDDLSAAIPGGLPGDSEWRIHYHMPVYLADQTTQHLTNDLLRRVLGTVDSVIHFETETYTWPMLPSHLRPNPRDWIAEGIAGELRWARAVFESEGYALVR